jgi:AsmA-like C-terminal region
VKINIPDGMLANIPDGGDIPPEAVDLRLDLENLIVRYWGELPVMQTAKSTAAVSGRKFFYNVPDATVTLPSGDRVQLTSGEFIIGDLRPKVPNAEIHFKTQSDASAAFEFLDHEPLRYIQKLKIKPPQVDAPLTTTFSMALPLLKEVRFADLRMNGRAHLQDVRATDLPGGMGIHGGTMDFDISETAIEARGDVKMNGMPVKIAWQRFYDAPPDRQPPLRLRAIIDEAARQEMGMEVNHVLRGPVAAELTLNMRKDQPPLIRFEANLSDTDIIMGSMGWRKPPGQRAMLSTDIEPGDNGTVALRNLNIGGDDIAVRGELTLNDKRQPIAFRFPTLSLNLQTQMELSGELTNNVWKVRGTGSSYDGRQFFRSLFSAGKITEDQPQLPKNTPGVDLKLELDNVFGFFDTTVKKVSLEARRRNDKLIYLDLHGRLNGKDPVAARLDATKPGDPRTLLAEATDGGAAFRLVGFYPSARGGEVSLKVNLDGSGPAEKYGVLYARNFIIVGDQIVGEVLSGPKGEKATVRTRPASEYSQQLEFENLRVPFSVGSGQFVIHDGIINGPVLGATMRGNIDFRRERISLSGTYVPLFGLNAAISGVPILGDILSGRHGEGIFGITFAVQGATSNPNVLVNPMSLVAPGFLRQLFEFDQTVPHIIPPDRRPPEKSSNNTRASSFPPATR